MNERNLRLLSGGIATLVVVLLLGVFATVRHPANVTKITARTPAITQTPPQETEKVCFLDGYRNDAAQADFHSPHKKSRDAIGPPLLALDKSTDDPSKAEEPFWDLMCGPRANSLAALGVLTALAGGHIPHFANKQELAKAVEQLMNNHYSGIANVTCGEDPAGYRTVFADTSDGHLKLGKTTIREKRKSCYLALQFAYSDKLHWVDFRVECLQATATDLHTPKRDKVTWYLARPI